MISKDCFVAVMSALRDHDAHMDEFSEYVFNARNKCFTESDFITKWSFKDLFNSDDALDNILKALAKELNDEYDWISYFIWELDWGKDYVSGCVTDDNGNIDISTLGNLYDYIIGKPKYEDKSGCLCKDTLDSMECVQYDGENKISIQLMIDKFLSYSDGKLVYSTDDRKETINKGDWIVKVKDSKNFFVLTDEEFKRMYKEI